MLKLSFRCCVLGILMGSLLFFYRSSSFSQTPPPRLVVASQPSAPLLILTTFVDAGNPLRPRFGYSITNTTDKAIVAYAIQESVSLEPGSAIVTTTLTHLPAKNLLLGPHAALQEEGGGAKTYAKAPIEVSLSVDFVEFEDATKWGDDKTMSSERLAGERAGAKEALKRYREVFTANGINALRESLTATTVEPPAQDSKKSGTWVDGFRTGAGIVKNRLTTAQTKGGAEAIRRELAKPYDSTEGRLEPW